VISHDELYSSDFFCGIPLPSSAGVPFLSQSPLVSVPSTPPFLIKKRTTSTPSIFPPPGIPSGVLGAPESSLFVPPLREAPSLSRAFPPAFPHFVLGTHPYGLTPTVSRPVPALVCLDYHSSPVPGAC